MGPLPKRKLSKTSKRKRRTHDRLDLPHLVVCPNCGEYTLAHRVCKHCGYYKGDQVVEMKSESK